jgi:hypothetical protein
MTAKEEIPFSYSQNQVQVIKEFECQLRRPRIAKVNVDKREFEGFHIVTEPIHTRRSSRTEALVELMRLMFYMWYMRSVDFVLDYTKFDIQPMIERYLLLMQCIEEVDCRSVIKIRLFQVFMLESFESYCIYYLTETGKVAKQTRDAFFRTIPPDMREDARGFFCVMSEQDFYKKLKNKKNDFQLSHGVLILSDQCYGFFVNGVITKHMSIDLLG